MKEKMVYQCEFCHTEFNNKKDCQECEAFHTLYVKVSEKHYHCYKADQNSFPHSIILTDKNGTRCKYRRA